MTLAEKTIASAEELMQDLNKLLGEKRAIDKLIHLHLDKAFDLSNELISLEQDHIGEDISLRAQRVIDSL